MWKTFSSGVDWVTTTAELFSAECDGTEDLALTTLSEQLRDGYKMRPNKRLQFDGLQTDHVFIGRSTTHQMVQVSGSVAHRFALRLREEVKDARITRIDFEATMQEEEADERRARKAHAALESADYRTATGRQTVANLISRPSCGDTLYIGARVSESSLRFYNKTAESGGTLAERLWRCEREHKGRTARLAYDAFCISDEPTQLCFNVVKASFQDAGFLYELPEQGDVVRLPTVHEKSDNDRQEDWLSKLVARTAQQIEERRGPGHVERLLGLKSAKPNKSV